MSHCTYCTCLTVTLSSCLTACLLWCIATYLYHCHTMLLSNCLTHLPSWHCLTVWLSDCLTIYLLLTVQDSRLQLLSLSVDLRERHKVWHSHCQIVTLSNCLTYWLSYFIDTWLSHCPGLQTPVAEPVSGPQGETHSVGDIPGRRHQLALCFWSQPDDGQH